MSPQISETNQISPFQSIALSFSGGGFRAAAFSLGVLSYLHKVKMTDDGKTSLLGHVNFIASASGGTITNLLYSSYLFKYKDEEIAYRKCFAKLYADMKGEHLLEEATRILADSKYWEPAGITKQRNVINAFSKAYDEKLFDGETFDIFWKESWQRDFSACFNATEFTRGISFRFQHESSKNLFSLNGNRYIHFKPTHKNALAKLKLADILAASSCFPSGFEPIIFPSDFAYPATTDQKSLTIDELKEAVVMEDYHLVEKTITESIALMDGGVTDNQALYSVMHADTRRRKESMRPFDMIMVNDVTSYFMEPYNADPPLKSDQPEKNLNDYLKKLTTSYKWFKWIRVLSIGLLLLSIAGLLYMKDQRFDPFLYFIAGFTLLGVVVMTVLQNLINVYPGVKDFLSARRDDAIKKLILEKSKGEFSESVISNLLNFLKETKLSNLKHLVMARVNSIITMTVEVNLKQVRRLIYSLFYENEKWDNRRGSNFIYELSTKNEAKRREKFETATRPDPTSYLTKEDKEMLLDLKTAMPVIADAARSMGTTLWFGKVDEDRKMLDKIIQCGQFSTCANLLEYTLTLIRQAEDKVLFFDDPTIKKLNALKATLEDDWEAFKDKPDFYFNEEVNGL